MASKKEMRANNGRATQPHPVRTAATAATGAKQCAVCQRTISANRPACLACAVQLTGNPDPTHGEVTAAVDKWVEANQPTTPALSASTLLAMRAGMLAPGPAGTGPTTVLVDAE